MNKQYLTVGSWNFRGGTRGLTLCHYESGIITPIKTVFPEINVGMQTIDPENKIIYLVEETSGPDREGGYILAVKYDTEEENLTILSRKRTFGCNPSYCALDHSGRYLIVVHHDEGTPDGDNSSSAIVLFRINKDGTIGDIADFYRIHSEIKPHVHSVYESPDGSIYIMSDKGLDKVYAFRLNRDEEKLELLNTCFSDEGSAPRYGAFHPTLPYFYGNNEHAGFLYKYEYGKDGILSRSEPISLLDGTETGHVEPSDLAITADGKYLYAAIRGINRIVTYTINPNGDLEFLASTPCGDGPRGLYLSPDESVLLACNIGDNAVQTFRINEHHLPESPCSSGTIQVPGNLQFLK